RQALLHMYQEMQSGNQAKATRFNEAAEASAAKLLSLERDIRDHEKALLEATSAAERAKQAVAQNAANLQKRLSERESLLGALDQAKMQEELNKAMARISSTIGEDVPTFHEVRQLRADAVREFVERIGAALDGSSTKNEPPGSDHSDLEDLAAEDADGIASNVIAADGHPSPAELDARSDAVRPWAKRPTRAPDDPTRPRPNILLSPSSLFERLISYDLANATADSWRYYE